MFRRALASALLVSTSGIASLAGLNAHIGFAEDWPQYLGPNRNGISSESGLLGDGRKWS